MKAKKAKKTAKKKAAKKMAAPQKKAAPKKKAMKAKTKAKSSSKPNSKVTARTKEPAKKKSGGYSVQELFQMKIERESAAQNPDQHTTEIPAQDQHSPEAAKNHGSRKSGFGGSRHH